MKFTVRYSFESKFKKDIFSAKKSCDEKQFEDLQKILAGCKKLTDTFLPLHYKKIDDNEYMSIACSNGKSIPLVKGGIYEIEVSMKKSKARNGKTYINIYLNKADQKKDDSETLTLDSF